MALAEVERGLTEVRTNGRFYEAELHRLKGELMLAQHPRRAEAAEASLLEAVSVARMQSAGTFEQRAQASLLRLSKH